MLRTVGAVAAGCGATSVLALTADQLVRLGLPHRFLIGGNAELLVLLALLAATGTAVIAGSFLAAHMAPQRPLFHALLVGSVVYVLSLAAASILWTEAPAWFHNAVVLIQLPAAWIGGLLFFGRHPVRT